MKTLNGVVATIVPKNRHRRHAFLRWSRRLLQDQSLEHGGARFRTNEPLVLRSFRRVMAQTEVAPDF
jgi:hypothetical protein